MIVWAWGELLMFSPVILQSFLVKCWGRVFMTVELLWEDPSLDRWAEPRESLCLHYLCLLFPKCPQFPQFQVISTPKHHILGSHFFFNSFKFCLLIFHLLLQFYTFSPFNQVFAQSRLPKLFSRKPVSKHIRYIQWLFPFLSLLHCIFIIWQSPLPEYFFWTLPFLWYTWHGTWDSQVSVTHFLSIPFSSFHQTS